MNEAISHYGELPEHFSTPSHSEIEFEVQDFLENFSRAVRYGDLEEIMSFYADDVVAYDMMPPLRFANAVQYRDAWKECFTDHFEFPVSYAFSEQKIVAVGDGAYSFGLLHVSGTGKIDHQQVNNWIRSTICVQKRYGHWKIVHAHHSVPIDTDLKALMDLEPEEKSGAQ